MFPPCHLRHGSRVMCKDFSVLDSVEVPQHQHRGPLYLYFLRLLIVSKVPRMGSTFLQRDWKYSWFCLVSRIWPGINMPCSKFCSNPYHEIVHLFQRENLPMYPFPQGDRNISLVLPSPLNVWFAIFCFPYNSSFLLSFFFFVFCCCSSDMVFPEQPPHFRSCIPSRWDSFWRLVSVYLQTLTPIHLFISTTVM